MFTRTISAKRTILSKALFALLIAAAVFSLSGTGDASADSGWQARYWSNSTLSGDPVLEQTESEINHDWGSGAPISGIDHNHFSARWQRTIDVSAGVYRFTATMDDGMRVWVDGLLLIDSWWDSQVHSLSADYYLNSGSHQVKVEYYQVGGQAVAKLNWVPVSGPPSAIYNWRGEYFNNMSLSGQPAMVRDDPAIDFDWGGGAPAWNIVSADQFSARWTRDIYFNAGRYRFTVSADDGARLWVNGQLIIDQWHDASETYYIQEVDLPGGYIPIKMEYYEHNGGAVAKLSWLRIGDASFTGWHGQYFNNPWLSGTPTMERNDANINFNWAYGSPASGIPADRFSVRWTRDLSFMPGTYRFTTTADDGVRLWVKGRLLIDSWIEQPSTSYSATIYLDGTTSMKLEYFEGSNLASVQLAFGVDTPVNPPLSGGVVIVDDDDTGFVRGGSETGWRTAAAGFDGRLTYTWNNDKVRPGYNWGRWYPHLAAGRYELFVYIPDQHATTDNARYWISHQNGYTLRRVDQSAYNNSWVSLGTYTFRGTSRDYVSLADVTFENRLSHQIAYDAVKWEPR